MAERIPLGDRAHLDAELASERETRAVQGAMRGAEDEDAAAEAEAALAADEAEQRPIFRPLLASHVERRDRREGRSAAGGMEANRGNGSYVELEQIAPPVVQFDPRRADYTLEELLSMRDWYAENFPHVRNPDPPFFQRTHAQGPPSLLHHAAGGAGIGAVVGCAGYGGYVWFAGLAMFASPVAVAALLGAVAGAAAGAAVYGVRRINQLKEAVEHMGEEEKRKLQIAVQREQWLEYKQILRLIENERLGDDVTGLRRQVGQLTIQNRALEESMALVLRTVKTMEAELASLKAAKSGASSSTSSADD